MNHGFIKVAAVSTPVRVADCVYNADQAVQAIKNADAQGIHVLCLQELGLTGATCGDLFAHNTLLEGSKNALRTVRTATCNRQMVVICGFPLNLEGSLYNCAAVLYEGKILGIVPQIQPSDLDPFSPSRYFAAGPTSVTDIQLLSQHVPFGANQLFRCENLPSLTIACTPGAQLDVPHPFAQGALAGATVLCSLAADGAWVGAADYRRTILKARSAQLRCAAIYSSAGEGESTTDNVLSGHCMVWENGKLLAEHTALTAGGIVTEIDVAGLCFERRKTALYEANSYMHHMNLFSLPLEEIKLTRHISPNPFIPADSNTCHSQCADILDVQSMGLQKRLTHTCCEKIIVGLSGGLDSTLALLVCVRAMDALGHSRDNIIGITMPCFGTTARTKDNAIELAQALDITLKTIPITASVRQHFNDISLDENDHCVAYENAQARERTQVLMDVANQIGALVVGTGDMSELALGWATYNGDHMSMYGVNASVPKTLVRYLVQYEATLADEDLRDVLLDIVATPVSPELLPPTGGSISQKTEDLVGPYELHDFFLYYTLRWNFQPAKIFRLAHCAWGGVYDDATICKWLRVFFSRFFSQQFKRSCLPDGPSLGTVTISPRRGLQMPSDACFTLWRQELDTIESHISNV